MYECNWCWVWNAPGETGNSEQRFTLFGGYSLISVAIDAYHKATAFPDKVVK